MRKKILLTFDYELSLGGESGSVENCIIKPTNLILEILKENLAIGVFFIDTTYLNRLKEISKKYPKAKYDFDKISNQIIKMSNEGHYVFHHIHPHWIDANYNEKNNDWSLENKSKFTINQTSEKLRDKIFFESQKILEEILSRSNERKPTFGFRAGGLYIEPFSSFKPYFIKYGIKYDFSAVPFLIKKDSQIFYDFSKCPKGEYFYSFEDEAAIKNINGQFTEFTISQFKIKWLRKIINGIYYRILRLEEKSFKDGQSVSTELNSSNSTRNFMSYFISENILSTEIMNPILLPVFKRLIKKRDYLHFLSHPKLVSEINLEQFNSFLEYINKHYNIIYDFRKF